MEVKEKIQKVSEYKWLIPRTGGMHVPGVIYISEKLLDKAITDNAISQIENVAQLPGIVKYSLAMPDVHWGYGAPIGGVGAFDSETGVIVPGFVGYDINCLCEDAQILHRYGYWLPIRDCEHNCKPLVCFDSSAKKKGTTDVRLFIRKETREKIFEFRTSAGYRIRVTADHPLWTADGKKEAKDIEPGDRVIIQPFVGIPYEEPEDKVILRAEEFEQVARQYHKGENGNSLRQIRNRLQERNLLPLKYTSPHLPELIKLIGFLFGDGSISFHPGDHGFLTSFFGQYEDLIEVRQDLEKIQYKAFLYNRTRKHRIRTAYARYEFESTTATCQTASRSLALLLVALGVPCGNKTEKDFRVPSWILKSPRWQKRLFLAAFFGAELSAPASPTGHGYNFCCPAVSMNKKPRYRESGFGFMEDIASLLGEFGVHTRKMSSRQEFIGERREGRVRIRLVLSSRPKDLLNLYEKIGYEYSGRKAYLANVSAFYLRKKSSVVLDRERAAVLAGIMRQEGYSVDEIHALAHSPWVNRRFVERSVYEGRKTSSRIAFSFESWPQAEERVRNALGSSGFLFDTIAEIRTTPFQGHVYDFTVGHPDHNFVADNFLVSNCGVRLLRSELKRKDVQNQMGELINALFRDVPSGVGSTGKLRLKRRDLEEAIVQGAGWAVKQGFGTRQDTENIEEHGCMEGADPAAVSDRAFERGREQLETLGSGNHFLEIQVVTDIYDPEIAEIFGLFLGQITIMVHTGSRGFGYQICDDYLAQFGKAVTKYGISVPDRQLACAPVGSYEGQRYFKAMKAAANYAFCNRQIISHLVRETVARVLKTAPDNLKMQVVYDVAHNICKLEKHLVDGKEKSLYVHRKGATRAFPKNHPEVPGHYRTAGQPVIIPGSMGTASYVLVGTEKAMEETWGSTCHGAGRTMSRHQAIRESRGRSIAGELAQKGIIAQAASRSGLAEEMPAAYKDIDEVIKIVEGAGISGKVCRLVPLAVMKG